MIAQIAKDDARKIVMPFYEAFETGDTAALDLVFATGWRDNTLPPGRTPGLPGLKQALLFLRGIVPDVSASTEAFLYDDGLLSVHIIFSGTNTGGFPGIGPNGATVRFIAFDIHRISNSRVVESWHLEDNLALMIQLGVVPPIIT